MIRSQRASRIFRTLIMLTLTLVVLSPIRPSQATPNWSSAILIDTHTGTDIIPTALQAANGTIWVAWQSSRNSFSGRTDIIYKTNTNNVWSNDHNLTTTGYNSGPSLIQLSNGTILAFWSILSGTSYLVYSSNTNGRAWTNPSQTTSTILNDTEPSAAVARDGTIWLTWTRLNATCNCPGAGEQIYYKTWKTGVWSSDTKLTTDTNQNYGSNVNVAKDGKVRVTFSKGAAGNIYQIYEKIYNGTSWTADSQIVSSSSTDDHPSMLQDRNGTLWLFWDRLTVVTTLIQYYDVIGKYSYDMGATWSSEINLSHNPSTGTVDSEMPSAIQSNTGVKPLWVFYASNLNVKDLDIYAFMSTGINPVHDVTVTGIYASNNLGTTWEYPGGLKSVGQTGTVTVKVIITDIGDYVESVTAAVMAINTTSTSIGSVNHLIGPGSSVSFYYYWNTSNVRPGRYALSASMSPLSGETMGNMGDNTASISNQVHIIPLGDVDQDGSVTLTDVSVFYYDYGFSSSCNCSRWNPYADIQGTGVINIVDVGVASTNYDTFT